MQTLILIFGVVVGFFLLLAVLIRSKRIPDRSAHGHSDGSYVFIGGGGDFSGGSDCGDGSSGADGGGCGDGGGGGGGD